MKLIIVNFMFFCGYKSCSLLSSAPVFKLAVGTSMANVPRELAIKGLLSERT